MTTKLFLTWLLIFCTIGCTVHEEIAVSQPYIFGKKVEDWPVGVGGVEIYVKSSNDKIVKSDARVFFIKVDQLEEMPRKKAEQHAVIIAARAAIDTTIEWKPSNSKLIIENKSVNVASVELLELVYLDEKCRSKIHALHSIQLTKKYYSCVKLTFPVNELDPRQEFKIVLAGFSIDGVEAASLELNFRENIQPTILR